MTFHISCFCLSFLLTAGLANGQSVERHVVASAGDYFVTPNLSLSWTLGEAVTETVSNEFMMLSQGFQQGEKITFTTIKDPLARLFDIKVFPNPTSDVVNISINSEMNDILTVQIYSMAGEKVLTEKTSDKNIQLSLADLAPANYLLSLRKLNGELITTYSINKTK
jgi:hypothetical protein